MFKQIAPFTITEQQVNFTSIASIINKHADILKELPYVNKDSITTANFMNINKMKLVEEINDGSCDYYETEQPVGELKFSLNMITSPQDFKKHVTIISNICKLRAVVAQNSHLIHTDMKGSPVEELCFSLPDNYDSFDVFVKDNNVDRMVMEYILEHGMSHQFLVDLTNSIVVHKRSDGLYSIGDVTFCRYVNTVKDLTIGEDVRIIGR